MATMERQLLLTLEYTSMRIPPNYPRLRIVALACWSIGAWWALQPGVVAMLNLPPVLAASGAVLATIMIAIGVAFWLLAADRRSGLVFDSTGVSLNLGHSAAFVAWENIEAIGVTSHRASLFALGSSRQLGLRLHNPEAYLQSYEERLPAARGLFARGLRLIQWILRREDRAPAPTREDLLALRRRTGYDLIIPEAQLGGAAPAVVAIFEALRRAPQCERALQLGTALHP